MKLYMDPLTPFDLFALYNNESYWYIAEIRAYTGTLSPFISLTTFLLSYPAHQYWNFAKSS